MRLRIACFLLLAAGVCRPAGAQVDTEVVDAVRQAIGSGDAAAVLSMADDRVELGVFGAARLYSRSQARHVLGRFFADHPPAGVSLGDATQTEAGWYCAAAYHLATGGPPLRMYLRLRNRSGRWIVREIVVLGPER